MQDYITKEEFYAEMQLVHSALKKLTKKGKYISRAEIIEEHGRKLYEDGVKSRKLTPIKGKGRTARVKIERDQLEAFINSRKS